MTWPSRASLPLWGAAPWVGVATALFVVLTMGVTMPLHRQGRFQGALSPVNAAGWLAAAPGLAASQVLGLHSHRGTRPVGRVVTPVVSGLTAWGAAWAWGRMWGRRRRSDSDAVGAAVSAAGASGAAVPAASTSAGDEGGADGATGAGLLAGGRVSRRALLRGGMVAGAAAASAATGHACFVEPWRLEVTRRTIPIRNLAPELSGLRFVQVTDVHHGPWFPRSAVRSLVELVNALEADVVALTGDYVLRSAAYVRPVAEELGRLRAKVAVLGVLGNHDWWAGVERVRTEFARAGIPLIDNHRTYVTRGRKHSAKLPADGGGLCIAGVGDYLEDVCDFARALRGVPWEMPRVLLSHNPDAAELGGLRWPDIRADLMLCGHTHGGQVSLPLVGTPRTGSSYGQKYVSGLNQGPACPVYTCRGVGTALLPIRWGVRAEVAVIEIVSE